MAPAANPLGVLEKSLGEAVAFAAGIAIAPLLAPYVQELKNATWAGTPSRPLSPNDLAEAIAQGEVDEATAAKEAKMSGLAETPFKLLAKISDEGPELGTAYNLWRRGHITDEGFASAVKKAKIEDRWLPALKNLKLALLSPGEISAAIHRGLIADPGLLQGEQPSGDRNVASYPVYPIDALTTAAGHGLTKDQLGVLVGLQGLPMGVIEAAHAYYRGILTKGDYIAAFNESNNRNEWANAVLDYARQIPTARDYIENALRGYRTLAEAQKGAARHGMSAADALLIFQNSGRPLNLKQITQAQAWGGKYQPAAADNPDPWVQAVLLGAVRPEYYNLQEHLKYNLPSALYFRTLQTQGVLTEAEAVTWYKRLGWPPELAEKVAAAFAKPTGAKADPYVTKAETQLWNATHRSYLAGEADEATAIGMLDVLGLSEAAKSAVIGLWTNERTLRSKQLTAAQIKKAWRRPVINPATGRAWSFEDAVQALVALGYSLNDANTFLAE